MEGYKQKCGKLQEFYAKRRNLYLRPFVHLRHYAYCVNAFFFFGEHFPDATEAFQLSPKRHLSLHHNGKDSLATETGAVEQTPVMWS